MYTIVNVEPAKSWLNKYALLKGGRLVAYLHDRGYGESLCKALNEVDIDE